ncbi:hypothetical protein PR048_006276 [Dryococelus australis]|uniref:Uncharacterized protein n=1 Tax=Dryococelus australis TaxID=614101 RepID=A0ABQ9IBI0_9NEOP|nr:hypothetical protein PR048_006276 [Dryococelus australis]
MQDELCTFFFVWHSQEVCFPSYQVACMATDEEGMVYDLSPLSLMSGNHVSRYRDATGHVLKFAINVCRSVVVGYAIVCRYQAAICMENISLADGHNK